jgi:hypothetical protein
MSGIGKKAKTNLGGFEPDFPSFGPYEGGQLTVPPESLEAFSQLFEKLSDSNWFCAAGEA